MSVAARNRFAWIATAGYAVLALAWIFLSDQLLSAFADIGSIVWLSTAKDVFFVAASAAGFYLALRAVPSASSASSERFLESLMTGFAPGRLPRWLTYVFAVAITLALLLVRDLVAEGFNNRPLLILFMFPIILSALLGGFGPGLVATVVAAVGVDYWAIPPLRSWRIANSHDLLQWCFLIVNGVAVSLLSEVLRRSLARVEINRHLLDSVVSSTPDAIFIKDLQGRYLLANAAAAGFIGKAPGEIIGRDDRFLFPEQSARELMTTDRAIIAGGLTQTNEERITTLDGKALVFLVTKGPVFNEAGEAVGLFGISREISERKQAEEEIGRLNAELERRVDERTAELQSANLELEELAYALTHNLRAPLRAISGFAQMLVEDQAGKLDKDALACLEQITQANSHMGQLLDGILALLRCTRGELQRVTVDLSTLANRRLEQLACSAPQRKTIVQVETGLAAIGDAAMLKMALEHLLDNAWKFTAGKADATIRVYAGAVDGQAGICIADNGAGFDMAHAEQLFQPFQRLHRQDEFPGTGIGLATVQRIVRRHGGELRASSAPGVGATFCFTLPSATAPLEENHE